MFVSGQARLRVILCLGWQDTMWARLCGIAWFTLERWCEFEDMSHEMPIFFDWWRHNRLDQGVVTYPLLWLGMNRFLSTKNKNGAWTTEFRGASFRIRYFDSSLFSFTFFSRSKKLDKIWRSSSSCNISNVSPHMAIAPILYGTNLLESSSATNTMHERQGS